MMRNTKHTLHYCLEVCLALQRLRNNSPTTCKIRSVYEVCTGVKAHHLPGAVRPGGGSKPQGSLDYFTHPSLENEICLCPCKSHISRALNTCYTWGMQPTQSTSQIF